MPILPAETLFKLSPQVSLYTAGGGSPALTSGSEIRLAQSPSKAFGDGSHPTTRLCAGAVDLICKLEAPQSVLDVGTGTGILARIARARGVPFVFATDIDSHALAAAEANGGLDRHSVPILIANTPPDTWGPRFDLIVANILEGPLRDLARPLADALTSGGTLLLSGFTRLQSPVLRTVFTSLGLTCVSESTLEEWCLLKFQKPIPPKGPIQ